METEKEYCVIDCRVSDTSQLRGDSLDDQEVLARRVAEARAWPIARVFKKSHSATTTEREDIQEIIDFIRKSDLPIRHYVFKSVDRFTRAGYPEYDRMKTLFEKFGVQIWDTYGMIQAKRNTLEHLGVEYKWSKYSPSEAAEMLASYQGKQEARDILTRMVGAEIRYVRDGWAIRRAPDGLRNSKAFCEGRARVIRERNPDRAHFWEKAFQMRADGVGDPEIVSTLNAMGYRTPTYNRWDKKHEKIIGKKGGKLLTVKQLQRNIKQTEYAGVIYELWTKDQPVRTQQFQGIVSIEVFNRANRGSIYILETEDGGLEVRHNYSPWGRVKRLRNNPTYPWKVISCPFCNLPVLGSASRGKSGKKHEAYHCGGLKSGRRSHQFFRVPKSDFDKNINQYLDSLQFEPDFLEGLETKLIAKYREREKEIVLASSLVSRNVADLKTEQHRKLEAFGEASSAVTRRMLEVEIEELDQQIKEAEATRGRVEINEKSIKSFIRYARGVMEHPAEILVNAEDLEARKVLMSLFFEEIPTYHEILNGTPKLQPLFRLSEEFKRDKTQLVTLRGIEPRFTP